MLRSLFERQRNEVDDVDITLGAPSGRDRLLRLEPSFTLPRLGLDQLAPMAPKVAVKRKTV